MNKFLILTIIVFCFLSTDGIAKKKLYKWVDENGNVSYSDQMPPEQIKKAHEEINDQGIVLEKHANAKTDAEILAMKKQRLADIEAEKQAKALEKQRQNIIKAYTNEQEIIRLKEERLSALERNIASAKTSLEFQKTSREQLLSMAADKERNGAKVSKALKSRIVTIEEKIQYQAEFIEIKKKEIQRVKDKFANDLSVYREAKQATKKLLE
jgi:hypothetical protein